MWLDQPTNGVTTQEMDRTFYTGDKRMKSIRKENNTMLLILYVLRTYQLCDYIESLLVTKKIRESKLATMGVQRKQLRLVNLRVSCHAVQQHWKTFFLKHIDTTKNDLLSPIFNYTVQIPRGFAYHHCVITFGCIEKIYESPGFWIEQLQVDNIRSNGSQ